MGEPLLALTEVHKCTHLSGSYCMSSESSYLLLATEGDSSEITEGDAW